MSTSGAPAVPALPDRQRHFRWGYFLVRLLLVAALLAAAAWLPNSQGAPDSLRVREGDIARERVVAPYDFRVEKDEATLRREYAQAVAQVPPVFFVDATVSTDMLQRYGEFE